MSKYDRINKSLAKLEVPYEHELPLAQVDSWPKSVHLFDKDQIWALRTAVAAERPLLVRGEPGTGKSQLARAAAELLGRAFIYSVIYSGSECQDLQFHFDEVTRLGKAQILATVRTAIDVEKALDPENFISPGALWWAFDWHGAKAQYGRYATHSRIPHTPAEWDLADGSVVLIDEIDKAEPELPNGLLETLGNGSFTIPFMKEAIGLWHDSPPPLIIITTNEERELPDAFVRRCLVLHLSPPVHDDVAFAEWLKQRGRLHFRQRCSEEVLSTAAEMLIEDRKKILTEHRVGPGQAEYLDMLRAVNHYPAADQVRILHDIRKFALLKHQTDRSSPPVQRM